MNNTVIFILLSLSVAANIVFVLLFVYGRIAYRKLMRRSLVDDKRKKELVDEVPYYKEVADAHDKILLDALQHSMDVDKIYLNPLLNIQEHAKQIGTNKTKLSYIVNTYLNINYASFLSKYRVREAIKLLSDKQYFDTKIEEIGEMSGFGTRQAFHSAFKKEIGITPTHFRNISKSI